MIISGYYCQTIVQKSQEVVAEFYEVVYQLRSVLLTVAGAKGQGVTLDAMQVAALVRSHREKKNCCRINMYTWSNAASPEATMLTLKITMPPNSAEVANPSCQAYQHLNCMMKHEPIYLHFSFVQLVRLCFSRIPLDSPSPLSVLLLPIYAGVDAIHDSQPQGIAPGLIHTIENGII